MLNHPITTPYHTISIQDDNTAIMLAALNGHLEVVTFLKENGANMEHTNKVGRFCRVTAWYN